MEGSMNVVAEWEGTEKPEEVVIVSGHLDSWDVGVGAMDDGGGLAISWQALSTLSRLGMRAKRTVRVVGWVGEEFGGYGGQAFFERHKQEEERVVMIVESDMGVFRPRGMSFSGGGEAGVVMEEVMSLLAPINASLLITDDGRGYETDTGPWEAVGVPGASLSSENEKYFNFHHSEGDQMGVLKKEDMDLAAAVFAVVAFVVADLDEALPREGEGEREGGGVVSEILRRA
jgi:carboxypeptidase Q